MGAEMLVGVDGNAFSVMGVVQREMKKADCSQEEINEYLQDAQSDDYDHLLAISIKKLDELD